MHISNKTKNVSRIKKKKWKVWGLKKPKLTFPKRMIFQWESVSIFFWERQKYQKTGEEWKVVSTHKQTDLVWWEKPRQHSDSSPTDKLILTLNKRKSKIFEPSPLPNVFSTPKNLSGEFVNSDRGQEEKNYLFHVKNSGIVDPKLQCSSDLKNTVPSPSVYRLYTHFILSRR